MSTPLYHISLLLSKLTCKTKPATDYNTKDAEESFGIGFLLNISWTLKGSALFLLMSNWNYLFAKLTDKQFMSSLEFKFYITYSIISFFLYPALQLGFIANPLLSTVAPQLVSHIENITLCCLAEFANYRFYKARLNVGANLKSTFDFWIQMNHILATALILDGVCLGIINFDIVGNYLVIYKSKFWTDLLSAVFNISFTLTYAVTIYILFRKDRTRKIEKDSKSLNSTKITNNSRVQQDHDKMV